MKKIQELEVRGTQVRVTKIDGNDFVCLTDVANRRLHDEIAIHHLRILCEVEDGRKYLK